jgi:hypothetical protein
MNKCLISKIFCTLDECLPHSLFVPHCRVELVFDVERCDGRNRSSKNAFDDEEDKGPWEEIASRVAARHQNESAAVLRQPTATQKFAVDPKSINVGKDGVVRYTVVSGQPWWRNATSAMKAFAARPSRRKSMRWDATMTAGRKSRRDQWEAHRARRAQIVNMLRWPWITFAAI